MTAVHFTYIDLHKFECRIYNILLQYCWKFKFETKNVLFDTSASFEIFNTRVQNVLQ